MKVELVTIGNFIEGLAQEEEVDELRSGFWKHVAGFWPVQDPRPPGDQLSKMYNKILDSQNATSGAIGASLANGHSVTPSATAA